jgi:hypothetical protein
MTEVQIAYRDHGCKEDVRRMTALKRAWRGDGRSMQRSESSCSRQEEKESGDLTWYLGMELRHDVQTIAETEEQQCQIAKGR